MKSIKMCPDLIGFEDRKSVLRNSLFEMARVPIMQSCVKTKCVAYKDGICKKYNNEVEGETE